MEDDKGKNAEKSAEETPANKRLRAVALSYELGDKAPHVVASGAGEIARRILQLAEEHNVPIRRDDSLVEILSKLDLGYEIPSETYHAVAQILAFLYRTDEAWRKRKSEAKQAKTERQRPRVEEKPAQVIAVPVGIVAHKPRK